MSNNLFLILLLCSTSILTINMINQQYTCDEVVGSDEFLPYDGMSDANYYDEPYYGEDEYYGYDEEDCVEQIPGEVVHVDDDYFNKHIQPNVDSNLFDMRLDEVDPNEDDLDDAEFQKELEKWDDDTLLDELNAGLTGRQPDHSDDIDYATVCIDDFLDEMIEEHKVYDHTDEEIDRILRDGDSDVEIVRVEQDDKTAEINA
jgi:hypothetical protein